MSSLRGVCLPEPFLPFATYLVGRRTAHSVCQLSDNTFSVRSFLGPDLYTQNEGDKLVQHELRSRGKLPRHIAVIMDGNGRWAEERGLPRAAGHQAGITSLRDVTRSSRELGVDYLTV